MRNLSSNNETITPFEVKASAPDARLDQDATTVIAGSRISFHGSGFTAGEGSSAWVTLPNGSATAVADLASSSSEMYFSYDVAVDAPTGSWAITVYGQSLGRFLVGSFNVTR